MERVQDIDDRRALELQELLKEERAREKLDRERVDQFRLLEKHGGWLAYQALLSSKIQEASDMLLQPAQGLDGMVRTEFQKGAMYGLILARDLVRATVMADDEARKSNPADSAEQEIEDE